MNNVKRRAFLAGIASLALLATACGDDESSSDTTQAPTTAGSDSSDAPTSSAGSETTEAMMDLAGELNASGATFPKTFYEEAMAEFMSIYPDVTINYAGGGSGKGKQDLADQVVDWAGTDSTIKDEDLPGFKGGDVLYFPTVVAPITVSYNLDIEGLQLNPDTIAKIFLRQITNWNDPEIAAENPDVTLPDQAIVVAHRSDGSGTTKNFTTFLDRAAGPDASGIWTLGAGDTVEWPADTQAGEGNGGVAQIITSTVGAIGYVDLSDATDAGLNMALVQNSSGNYVGPTVEGASAAAGGAEINDNLTYSAIWADGADAYPITAQTWIIVYKVQPDAEKGMLIKAFLEYVLTDGQDLAGSVSFAPLPAELQQMAIDQLDQLEIG